MAIAGGESTRPGSAWCGSDGWLFLAGSRNATFKPSPQHTGRLSHCDHSANTRELWAHVHLGFGFIGSRLVVMLGGLALVQGSSLWKPPGKGGGGEVHECVGVSQQEEPMNKYVQASQAAGVGPGAPQDCPAHRACVDD